MSKAQTTDKNSTAKTAVVVSVKKPAKVTKKNRSAVVKSPAKTVERGSALAIVGTITTEQLKSALEIQTEQRQLIKDFVNQHLHEGSDYGKLHVVKGCYTEEKQKGSCDKDYHYSKSILLKPGQEKIFSLFSITDELIKDQDAYMMLPDVKGLVAYKCILYQNGKKIGEGRGAATLASERSDPNSTIKKAQKRARMDACLSLGFSEYFTQDLDDPEYASQREMANSRAEAEAERRDKDEFGLMPRDPGDPIDNRERAVLHRLLLKAGFSDSEDILELLRNNGIDNPTTMTSGQAREMMGKISTGLFIKPEPSPQAEQTTEPVYTDTESQDMEEISDALNVNQEIEPISPDLQKFVAEIVEDMQLTARGNMWFKAKCGAPSYYDFSKFTDSNWRKASELAEQFVSGDLKVELTYIKDGADMKKHPAYNIEQKQEDE